MAHFPTNDPRVPGLMRRLADLEREVATMRQKQREEYNPRQHRQEITFSFSGRLKVGTTRSGIYQIKESDGVIQRVDWNVFDVAAEAPPTDPGGGST